MNDIEKRIRKLLDDSFTTSDDLDKFINNARLVLLRGRTIRCAIDSGEGESAYEAVESFCYGDYL